MKNRLLNLPSRLVPATFAVFVMVFTLAIAQEKPSGVWTDADGEYYLDLNQKTYNGIDDGCQINKMSPSGKGVYRLAVTCGTADIPGETKTGAILTKRKDGWRLKFDQDSAENFTDFTVQKTTEIPSEEKDQYIKTPSETWTDYKGPEARDVYNWAKAQVSECYAGNGKYVACPMTEAIMGLSSFKIKGGPEDLTLVVLVFPLGGNNWHQRPMLFAKRSGRHVPIGEIKGIFGRISAAELRGSDILVYSDTLQGNDGRCCPTGKTVWKVNPDTWKAAYFSGNKL